MRLLLILLLLTQAVLAKKVEVQFPPPRADESLYRYVEFDVPPGTGSVKVTLAYDKTAGNTVDLGLFDSSGFRGWSGGKRSEVLVSADRATPGYLPGPMPPGRWKVVLGLYEVNPEGVRVRLDIEVTPGESQAAPASVPEWTPRGGPAWYRGDLHMHTEHSDGDQTTDQLVAYARQHGLRFLGLTEHNTVSHHRAFSSDVLLIPGLEVTTRRGHFNVWGAPRGHWLDFRSAIEPLFEEVRQLGGVLSVNHPFATCKGCVWEYGFDLPCDSMEVWNGPWDPTDELALENWLILLAQGRRLPMVGSSDSHKMSEPIGRPTLHVWAEELSQEAILAGVRAGRSYATATPDAPPLVLRAGGREIGETLPVSGPVEVQVEGPGHLILVSANGLVPVRPGKTRLELSRFVLLVARDATGQVVGLTNPIYLQGL